MANNLTGDFDLVAEFSLPAVNRILAAMHECERFLHSISVRVDDNPPPGNRVPYPTVVGVLDAFGEAVANQRQARTGPLTPGPAASSDPAFTRFGGLVNPGQLVFTQGGAITPSQIQGVAQLQLFPPTVSVPEGAGNYLTITTNVMVRYFPDKNSAPLAQFMRGNLAITAPVNKIASGRVHVLDIDFKASDAGISFTPTYSSESLTPEDLAGINLCIQNGLRSSFLPSSVMLPSSVADVQLKSMPGALAVLLDMNDHTPASNVGSVSDVFLGAGDDFGFAISHDLILSVFNSAVGSFTQFQPFQVSASIYGSTTYTITLTSPPSLQLQPGAIVLSLNAHAHSSKSRFPSFNFTTNISFTLALVATGAGGLNAAELALAGVSVDFTDSGVEGWIKDLLLGAFNGNISGQISAQVNNVLNPANPQPTDLQSIVRHMTDADANLGDFLSAQLSPSDGTPPPYTQKIFLIYTSFDIQPAGIVLHGSLLLYDWPPPNVEFEQIPVSSTGPLGAITPLGQGKDYSALKTWIPGGTIQQYEWSYQGQTSPFRVDPNTFVLLPSGPSATEARVAPGGAVSAYSPLCLTVRGSRISNFGPEIDEAVSAGACAYTSVSLVPSVAVANAFSSPSVALTRPGPDGNVIVSGYTSAQSGGNLPNLLLHFADSKTATQLDVLNRAVLQTKKSDSATAIVAVLPPGQLSRTRYTPGIIYAEDGDGMWKNRLGLKSAKAPLTAILSPRGTVTWQGEGPPNADNLATALTKYLAPTGAIAISIPRLAVRVGQAALNFLFEFSPGRDIPLTKIGGQPVVLVFWKSSSRPSVDAVLDAQNKVGSSGVVLAVNDGESAELVRSFAAENKWSAVAVSDPNREITSAYNITIWPTTVSLNEAGTITSIVYGYPDDKHGKA
jgi:hypothetical protein